MLMHLEFSDNLQDMTVIAVRTVDNFAATDEHNFTLKATGMLKVGKCTTNAVSETVTWAMKRMSQKVFVGFVIVS